MSSDDFNYYSFEGQSSSLPVSHSEAMASPYALNTGFDAVQPLKPGFASRPQFRQPHPKKQQPGTQIYYCEICRISCAGPQPYADHLGGQKHKKKEVAAAHEKAEGSCKSSAGPVSGGMYCELCDVRCGSVETFAAHINGVKHQRVMNLHTMLGKSIPEICVPQVAVSAADIQPQNMKTEDTKASESKPLAAEKEGSNANIEPVGVEFVEEIKNEKGLIVSYNCKLCECSFTDPNARRVHLRGRRHRLQYKRKVDMTLFVENKQSVRTQKVREERTKKQQAKEIFWRQQDMLLGMSMEQTPCFGDYRVWPLPRQRMVNRPNTIDDRYMINKHLELYPQKEKMAQIHSDIALFETALKMVSDVLVAEDGLAKKSDSTETSEKVVEDKKQQKAEESPIDLDKDAADTETTAETEDLDASRLVKGAMRVGHLSKGLLLRDEVIEHLVIICSERPTQTLLRRIQDQLPVQLETVCPEKKFNIEMRIDEAGFYVTMEEPKAEFRVVLTSTAVNEDNAADDKDKESSEPGPKDLLSREKCLSALALLRRTKWFQVRLGALKAGVVVTHVIRDLCRRNPIWNPLKEWAQELLVEKCIFSAGVDIGPGEALRSFFECISSGILLPGGSGLVDPCEKIPTDVSANLTEKQAEDITASAQTFLRMVVFRQIYKVLDVEPYKRGVPKRKREEEEKPEASQEEKKMKDDVDADDDTLDTDVIEIDDDDDEPENGDGQENVAAEKK